MVRAQSSALSFDTSVVSTPLLFFFFRADNGAGDAIAAIIITSKNFFIRT